VVPSDKHEKCLCVSVFVSTFDHVLISVFLCKLRAELVGGTGRSAGFSISVFSWNRVPDTSEL